MSTLINLIKNEEKRIFCYSGTTLDNFRKCALESDHKIYFDKLREPRHKHKEIYASEKLSKAIYWAFVNRPRIEDTPVILCSIIDKSIQDKSWAEVKTINPVSIPISSVLVPKKDTNFTNIDYLSLTKPEIFRYFELVNPRELLVNSHHF